MMNSTERAAADRILEALGRHTLALKIAGAYAAEAHRPLDAVATELEAARTRLAPRGSAAWPVQLAFRQSVRQLPPNARRIFALFAAFASPDVGRNAILEVAHALGIDEADRHLEALVRRALVDADLNSRIPVTADRTRLRLHPLLREHSRLMLRHWSDASRQAAHRAIAQYYADYVNATPDSWLAPDERNITGALEWAHEHGEDELVASLCDGMQYFWRDRGRITTSKHYLPWGMQAAEAVAATTENDEHRLRAVHLALNYGIALKVSGDLDTAESIFSRNLELRRQMGDRRGEGIALSNLGQITQLRSKLDEAERHFKDALAINREVHDRQGEGANLSYLGQIAQARGDLDVAERYYQRALVIFKEVQDRRGEGADLSHLAKVAQARYRWEEAETLYLQSLAIRREMEDMRGEGTVLSSLAQLGLARGDLPSARQLLDRSLAIRREVEDRWGEASDLSQFGRLFMDKGLLDESERYFRESRAIYRDLRDRAGEGMVQSQLALIAIERGHHDEAERLLRESLVVRHEVQDLRGEGVDRALLGRIALERGDFARARAYYEQSREIALRVQNRRGEGVDARQLGVIAEHAGHLDRAESLYRQSLEIARSVDNGLDIADALLELGRFLCERRDDREQGCVLLAESRERYATIGAPGARRAADVARRLGCGS